MPLTDMTDKALERSLTINDVLKVINYARSEGETDMRQIRNWIEALRTKSADELLAELKSD